MRQMSYSVCRFWAYDESKKIVGATGTSTISCLDRPSFLCNITRPGYCNILLLLTPRPYVNLTLLRRSQCPRVETRSGRKHGHVPNLFPPKVTPLILLSAGGIAGFVGNPGGASVVFIAEYTLTRACAFTEIVMVCNHATLVPLFSS